jgi:hypothetical protein
MRRILVAFGWAVLGAAAAGSAAAQQGPAGETVTITASVVDLSCKYVQNASGPDHKMCAQTCADKGQPLGLLTSDGQFLLPVNAGMGAAGENARLKAFAEEKVTVTGKVIKRGGVNAILIDKITKA